MAAVTPRLTRNPDLTTSKSIDLDGSEILAFAQAYKFDTESDEILYGNQPAFEILDAAREEFLNMKEALENVQAEVKRQGIRIENQNARLENQDVKIAERDADIDTLKNEMSKINTDKAIMKYDIRRLRSANEALQELAEDTKGHVQGMYSYKTMSYK